MGLWILTGLFLMVGFFVWGFISGMRYVKIKAEKHEYEFSLSEQSQCPHCGYYCKCPHCGYYCTGNSVYCTKGTEQPKPKKDGE